MIKETKDMKIDKKRVFIADLYKCSYFQEEPIFFAGKTYTGNYNIDGEFVNKVLVVKFGAEYALVSDIKNVLSYISMQGKVTKDELGNNFHKKFISTMPHALGEHYLENIKEFFPKENDSIDLDRLKIFSKSSVLVKNSNKLSNLKNVAEDENSDEKNLQ